VSRLFIELASTHGRRKMRIRRKELLEALAPFFKVEFFGLVAHLHCLR
jgi:hypothetical protein